MSAATTQRSVNNDIGDQLIASHVIPLIGFTILYYDYFLTLADELRLIWPPHNPLSLPSLLYLITRYLVVIGYVMEVLRIFMFAVNDKVCNGLFQFHLLYAGTIQYFILIICVLRVSAIYNNERSVRWILFFMASVCSILALYAIFSEIRTVNTYLGSDTQFPGCNGELSNKLSDRLAIPWGGLIVFDFTVFAFTLYKALSINYEHPVRLMTVLLRDGTMYFIALFASNLANVLMLIYAPALLKDSILLVTNILSSILIARLMLNLRAEARIEEPEEDPISSIEFRSDPPTTTRTGRSSPQLSHTPLPEEDIELAIQVVARAEAGSSAL
ncbi:hypothetical protein BT96DRAFT_503298 [Gymnopus androsaceus JB14]|uniref:DUF6533 domain-containing protein n=1 Tax=Gymnopus androsaceus JB14 TaxID=1447944 RepID=A0A6A4HXV3_9AGAR|nr:hypothetical protein BT96DRAFT_503298 [Gymnopus androsaceus JB14]